MLVLASMYFEGNGAVGVKQTNCLWLVARWGECFSQKSVQSLGLGQWLLKLVQMEWSYTAVLAESSIEWGLYVLLEAAGVLSCSWANTFILWACFTHIKYFLKTKIVLREIDLPFNWLLIFCAVLEWSPKSLKFCSHSRFMVQLQNSCQALETGEEVDLPSGKESETAELQIHSAQRERGGWGAVGGISCVGWRDPSTILIQSLKGFAAYQMVGPRVVWRVCWGLSVFWYCQGDAEHTKNDRKALRWAWTVWAPCVFTRQAERVGEEVMAPVSQHVAVLLGSLRGMWLLQSWKSQGWRHCWERIRSTQ